MKSLTAKESGKRPRLRRTPLAESALPPEAQELRRQFREWQETFNRPAARLDYIRQIGDRIARAYRPEKIILFGSHAYGQPTPESDVDLLVIMDFDGRPVEQAVKMSLELGVFTPMDLLVRTPAEVARRLREGDMFMREVVERGKVIYEAEHARMD